MSQPEHGTSAVEPVTLDELVQLMAGELTEAEEALVRMRMARDPNAPALLQRLRHVDAADDTDRAAAAIFVDMPEDVTERLRAHIAELARRSDVLGEPPAGPPDSASTT